jgi:hypothetical protein
MEYSHVVSRGAVIGICGFWLAKAGLRGAGSLVERIRLVSSKRGFSSKRGHVSVWIGRDRDMKRFLKGTLKSSEEKNVGHKRV